MTFRRLACAAFFAILGSLGHAQDSLDLAGRWRFALDRSTQVLARPTTPASGYPLAEGDGMTQRWFERTLPDRIGLPGLLQAQGYGDLISPDTPWVLTLGDAWWKLQPAALRLRFSQPGHVLVPFLAQPPRHYLGAAWYQRDVDVPAAWAGRQGSLVLERPHWESRVWWDRQALPADASLVAPHVAALGALTPGRHVLTVRIDNRRIVNEPAGNGHMEDAHSVSDALGAAWNGIVGAIELRSTPPAWLDSVQAYPDIEHRKLRLELVIGDAGGEAHAGLVETEWGNAAVSWPAGGGTVTVAVAIPATAQLWDEFHPWLQHLHVVLNGPTGRSERDLTRGLRDLAARDKDLLINGHVLSLRLTHFGGDFPLTGAPPTDAESWKKIFRACQAYGLNGMRFHSWCPPDAAFQAADELGFYLQPEGPLWAPLTPGNAYAAFLETETARMLAAYGNHPSFILLSPSNEPSGHYQKVTPEWASRWHGRDGRRLYSAGTGWSDPAQVKDGSQFASLVRFGHGELRNVSGWFGGDYRDALPDVHVPVIAHEVGQWCAYPDFAVIGKFRGYLQPGNYEIFKALAADQGVLSQDKAFAVASGRFQLACYKEEIEANLRTPGLTGFALLDLHDYLGQGTALIGVLDAFWESKGYVTAAQFSQFCGPVVPLARLKRRVFTSDESIESEVELYNFGEAPIQDAQPIWQLLDCRGRIVAHGTWGTGRRDLPLGKNLPLGHVSIPLGGLAAPASYRLRVALEGTQVENAWDVWVYPADAGPAADSGILVTADWDQAAGRLAEGGKVLFLPASRLDPATCPPMKPVPVFWNIQMTVRPPRNPTPRFDAMLGLLCQPGHPALAGFPTQAWCDWQWTALIDGVRSVNLSQAPRGLVPIVAAIDDWNRDWRLGVIFECAVGRGRLLVSAIDVTGGSPVTRALHDSLIAYMGSAAFAPKVALSPGEMLDLWPAPKPLAQPAPVRALDPDLDDGTQRRIKKS